MSEALVHARLHYRAIPENDTSCSFHKKVERISGLSLTRSFWRVSKESVLENETSFTHDFGGCILFALPVFKQLKKFSCCVDKRMQPQ
jgi:hypothetical protein